MGDGGGAAYIRTHRRLLGLRCHVELCYWVCKLSARNAPPAQRMARAHVRMVVPVDVFQSRCIVLFPCMNSKIMISGEISLDNFTRKRDD